ncbi:hypothetical protein [Dryocola sp. BD626]
MAQRKGIPYGKSKSPLRAFLYVNEKKNRLQQFSYLSLTALYFQT